MCAKSGLLAVQDWLGGMSFLDFLRDVGRFSRVNVMLSRDSVKTRLGREEGISFTEQVHLTYTSLPLSRLASCCAMHLQDHVLINRG